MRIETVLKVSNGTIFYDLERHLTQISRLRHYLTLNISETVGDRPTDIVFMHFTLPTLILDKETFVPALTFTDFKQTFNVNESAYIVCAARCYA